MTITIIAIRHLLPFGLILSLMGGMFPAPAQASTVRIDGLGVEMSALPQLTAENTTNIIARIKESGASYIRQEVDWSGIETTPDVYDWSATQPLDLIFSTAAANGLRVVATLNGGPTYLAAPGERVEQDVFIERWEKFVGAAVAHFGEQVDIWEIGSGVNSLHAMSSFLSPLSPDEPLAPDAEFYSKVIKTAAKIIKEGDPNDEVWLGSLTGLAEADCAMNPLTFLLELNAARGWRYIDAILYEPRQGSAAPEFPPSGTVNSACASNLMVTPDSLSAEVQAVQELARQLGGKPVVIGGLGWRGDDLAVLSGGREISAGQVEADLLVRATAALMAKNGVTTLFWSGDIIQNDSLFYAMTNLVEVLTDTAPVGELKVDAVYEYRFRKGGRNILLAWRVRGGDAAEAVTIDIGDIPALTAWNADSIELTEESGVRLPANNANEVTVVLNERPVILSGRSGDLAGSIQQLAHDQVELWGQDLRRALTRGFNEARGELGDLLEKWLEDAKDSAIEWGEGKIEELLP